MIMEWITKIEREAVNGSLLPKQNQGENHFLSKTSKKTASSKQQKEEEEE